MKIYNPFKPHIVQFDDGSYAIRKYNILDYSWAYYNLKTHDWHDTDFYGFDTVCKSNDLNLVKQKMKDIQVEDEKLKRKSLNKYGTKI